MNTTVFLFTADVPN